VTRVAGSGARQILGVYIPVRQERGMLTWYIAFGALGIWLLATLLYLRKYIVAWIAGRIAARRARRATKAQVTPGGPPRTP
jgi:hypothetical protein